MAQTRALKRTLKILLEELSLTQPVVITIKPSGEMNWVYEMALGLMQESIDIYLWSGPRPGESFGVV